MVCTATSVRGQEVTTDQEGNPHREVLGTGLKTGWKGSSGSVRSPQWEEASFGGHKESVGGNYICTQVASRVDTVTSVWEWHRL